MARQVRYVGGPSIPPCPSCNNGEWTTVAGDDSAQDPHPGANRFPEKAALVPDRASGGGGRPPQAKGKTAAPRDTNQT